MNRPPNDRDSILDAVLPIFANRGYMGATLTELADACGRGKASLYHHFPGGKTELAAGLVRRALQELDEQVFRNLSSNANPHKRLQRVFDGFEHYTAKGQNQCLLAIIAQTSPEHLSEAVQLRFRTWQQNLADTLAAAGLPQKLAQHQARAILARLYGALVLQRLTGSEREFKLTLKRIRKEFVSQTKHKS